MHFNTLENLSVIELTSLFNEAFADYFVKINLTPDILQEKINSEEIILNKSVGLFTNNQAVGFIFHALRNGVAYNAGTGVIPQFRGNNATVKMYDFILPQLKNAGLTKIVLEVIDENIQAIKSYEKVGFTKERNLPGFKGKLLNSEGNNSIKIVEIENNRLNELQSFWNWEPSWQHSTATIQKSTTFKTYGAFFEQKLVAYLTANPYSGRVAQFAVNPLFRKQRIATTLFQYLAKIFTRDISVINVDGNNTETHLFLEKIGLQHFLTQYKMILNLNQKIV